MSDPLKQIAISVELDPRIHYAMQQNDVPVVKAVHIENHSEVPLLDLEVRISTEPDFAQDWIGLVANVVGGATYNLEAVDLQLSPTFLHQVTERVRGQLRAEVTQDGQVIAESVRPVELLARDEWAGLSSLRFTRCSTTGFFISWSEPSVRSLSIRNLVNERRPIRASSLHSGP